jgi:elongation factor G
VPERFLNAIAEGLREAAERGPIAGFPVVDLACTLVDGGYHDVDSTEETFRIAARACLRETLPEARPRLFEPMMLVVALAPKNYMGEVIGDLNSRRGMVRSMESYDAGELITALAPLANLFGYGPTLRQITRGRARHMMCFDHYEQVPLVPSDGGGDGPFAPAAALRPPA